MVKCLNEAHGDHWSMYHADAVDLCRQLPDDSIGFTIYSPPFGDLFVYSDSIADMGNSSSGGQFFEHYSFLARELLRIMKPGRLVAVHCSDLPLRKWSDGAIGLSPFSDQLSDCHRDLGFILHSRVTIWRDPVVEMQRTKALGLLHKQLKKDSSLSRVGMPDYVLVFRKPGDNKDPISHRPPSFPVERWQKWASPVWMDIDQTDVLNVRVARDAADERHLCPLQLDLIERALVLWSRPGESVLSPFAGIGSEGVVAVKLKRRFLGVELKDTYWRTACRNLTETEAENAYPDLLAGLEVSATGAA